MLQTASMIDIQPMKSQVPERDWGHQQDISFTTTSNLKYLLKPYKLVKSIQYYTKQYWISYKFKYLTKICQEN